MKKNLFYLSITVVSLFFASCSKSVNFVITPDDAEGSAEVSSWYGDTNDFFEIVPGTYSVKDTKKGLQIEMQFIVKEQGKKKASEKFDSFELVPLDNKDNSIGNKIRFTAEDGASKMQELYTAELESKVSVVFNYLPVSDDEKQVILSKIASCYAILDLEEDDDDEEDGKEDDSYASSSSSSSEDWDAILDSYEKYVDQYINVVKKASNGDMNALSEMTSLMEKYEELAEQLGDASDEMSTSQMARYNKITMKIANAAM